MSKEYIVQACSGLRIDVAQGQSITVIDIEGGQVVDFFAEVTGKPNEFLSPGVTIDCNESLKLKIGSTIYTNLYSPMMEVLAAARKCMTFSTIMGKATPTVLIISIMPSVSNGPSLHLSTFSCTRKSILTVVSQ